MTKDLPTPAVFACLFLLCLTRETIVKARRAAQMWAVTLLAAGAEALEALVTGTEVMV